MLAGSADSPGMFVFAFVLINVVLIGLFGGIVWYLVALNKRQSRQRAGAGSPTTISRLSVRPTEPVAVVGRAEPGPRGPLTSPVTKTPCVWYRVELFQTSADLTTLISPTGASARKKVREVVSDATFVLTDGTGTVQVGPDDVAPDPDWQRDKRRTGRRPKPGELFFRTDSGVLTDGYEQREYAIPVDASLTLIGRLSAVDGRLARTEGLDPFVVSRRSPAQTAAASNQGARKVMRMARTLGIIGVLGLVFGNGLMVYAMTV
jgi:hypothetical protein